MSAPFLVACTTPIIAKHNNSDRKVEVELHCMMIFHVWDKEDRYTKIVVPAGFKTDLASIPRIFWPIPGFSPLGRNEEAAILHDYLYRKSCPFKFSRKEADQIFEAAMRFYKENVVVCKTTYLAVRLFASSSWKIK